MNIQQARELLKKYNDGTATSEEKDLVESWFLKLKTEQQPHDLTNDVIDSDTGEVWLALKENQLPVKSIRLWPRIVAAASVLIALSAGGYFILHKQQPTQIAQNQQHDAAPGKNQATLTLANGQKIILKSSLRGQIAQQGNAIIQAGSGQAITYVAKVPEIKAEYNTMSTAKGEMSPYPLVLADGTKVWLNANSSITFPTAFTGKERIVRVTGEAFITVAHNADQPFKLIAGGQTINDIGTEFNINAYEDEPVVTTTLASGSIKIKKGETSVMIKPGQQAVSKIGTNNIAVANADLEATLAWKNGLFSFKNADIQTVMRQLSRWYDVEVVYEGNIPTSTINGEIYRNLKASQLFEGLNFSKVKFRIEGKKIIVTNKN